MDENVKELDEKTVYSDEKNEVFEDVPRTPQKRWLAEHVHPLEERNRKVFNDKKRLPNAGSVVLITDISKVKTKWRIGRIVDAIYGRDGVMQNQDRNRLRS